MSHGDFGALGTKRRRQGMGGAGDFGRPGLATTGVSGTGDFGNVIGTYGQDSYNTIYDPSLIDGMGGMGDVFTDLWLGTRDAATSTAAGLILKDPGVQTAISQSGQQVAVTQTAQALNQFMAYVKANKWLFVGAAAAVVGGIGYLVLRKK